jgi:hypothetical protein
MRRTIVEALDTNPDLKHFIRTHPIWYRDLARRPDRLNEMKKEADDFFGKTWSKKLERMGQGLGMINMMLELMNMKDI